MAEVERVHRQLPAGPDDWRKLAALTAIRLPTVHVVGLSGGQGAGKTTLAELLIAAYHAVGASCVSVSLDDFYLTREERRSLGLDVHPLLTTRGVPGTHDIELAEVVLGALLRGEVVALPRFDKGRDDRAPETVWPAVGPNVDVVVFEGWCLGATPQPASQLETPVNDLERSEDPSGVWRAFVNEASARYHPLWAMIDWWIYLEVPGMQAVRRWRAEQEQDLPVAERMSNADLERFVQHYERLTLWLKSQLPGHVDWLVKLGENHEIRGLQARSQTSSVFR
ncbi:MAG: kinase [Gammaproteobacteria bacterium]|nr:kinase [Gammaproteobacteria bacterium]